VSSEGCSPEDHGHGVGLRTQDQFYAVLVYSRSWS